MKRLLIDTWFDGVTGRWTLTVWLVAGEEFDPETDRFYTLQRTETERSVQLENARQIAVSLRQAGYEAELLPVRPRWLEDSEEDVAGAIDGRLAGLQDFERQMAQALLGFVPAEQRLRVVTALEGRL